MPSSIDETVYYEVCDLITTLGPAKPCSYISGLLKNNHIHFEIIKWDKYPLRVLKFERQRVRGEETVSVQSKC